MWIEPAKLKNFHDPFWLLISPIKKYSHYMHVKQIINSLKIQGFQSSEAVFFNY